MRYLMILEVSQKQAYIFSSTKLRENIENSETICKVTNPVFFTEFARKGILEFNEETNLVYTGGGHTVLEFDSEEKAKKFAYEVSKAVRQDYHELELFIKVMPYDETKTPGANLENLSKELERKKSLRSASFHQGTFGVEKMDAALRKPLPKGKESGMGWNAPKEYVPKGYRINTKLDNIGNSEQESSFIAVVHIDGNAMGKRVEAIRKKSEHLDWNAYKGVMQCFSAAIDADFKKAYQEMVDVIKEAKEDGKLDALSIEDGYLPLRHIILAGDDVCFVTEGRIGIEAARIFIQKLSGKKNKADGQGYTACAGVAIVHQKYPFYKAYEMAELLCSSAKRYLASFQDKVPDAGAKGCAIDWHIEYGEIMDSLSDVREMYETEDGNRMELRPYILSAEDGLAGLDSAKEYGRFRKLMLLLLKEIQENRISKGKMKELRCALKEGEVSSRYYLKTNLVEDFLLLPYENEKINLEGLFSGKGMERNVFIQTADGRKRSLLFDAIEISDTFIALDEEVAP